MLPADYPDCGSEAILGVTAGVAPEARLPPAAGTATAPPLLRRGRLLGAEASRLRRPRLLPYGMGDGLVGA
jgi:hypothetical protein